MAECYYKTVTFSAEDLARRLPETPGDARRLARLGDNTEEKTRVSVVSDKDLSDTDSESGPSSLSSSSRPSSVYSVSSECQVTSTASNPSISCHFRFTEVKSLSVAMYLALALMLNDETIKRC